jgi:signal peptidase I
MNAALTFPADRPTPSEPTPTRHTPTQPAHEHPTRELPTLSFDEPRRRSAWSRLGALANQVVTVVLVLAVAAMLVVNVGPLFLPYRVYTVLSGSREPTIPVGSEVVLRQADASQIEVGDIITFTRPGHADQLVTHRVVSITRDRQTGAPAFITKGDANVVSDAWQIPAQGTGLKYLFHVPFLGYAFAMLQSPIGRICFILAPALLLAAVVLNDLWKSPKQRS